MTSLTKRLLDWTDRKYDEIDVETDKHWAIKVTALGFVEGAIDGAVFAYPILLAGCVYWRKKAEK